VAAQSHMTSAGVLRRVMARMRKSSVGCMAALLGDFQLAAIKKPPVMAVRCGSVDQIKMIAPAPPPLASDSRKTRNTGGRWRNAWRHR
jgi:hypothetical protein